MKNVTWLLLLVLFIYNIVCNDSILSKFHQNGYKIKDFRLELNSYKEKYFNFAELKTFKYNRTTPAVNSTFSFKITMKDKIEVLVQVRKFLSNEYRRVAVRYQVNLKNAMASGAIGLNNIQNCGNITTTYSFEKDVIYHFCNFVIDETRCPPLVPNGRYKIEMQMLYLEEEIAMVYLYGEVYTPIPYPKN